MGNPHFQDSRIRPPEQQDSCADNGHCASVSGWFSCDAKSPSGVNLQFTALL
jgi:hypothetical protein